MVERKPFALRLNADILKALERWAQDDFRSVNGQIEWLLHQALLKQGRIKDEEKLKPGKLNQNKSDTEQ